MAEVMNNCLAAFDSACENSSVLVFLPNHKIWSLRMHVDELTHKFVAVLNKKIPAPKLFNALGHMAVGLAGSYPHQAEMRFDTYHDKDGGVHKSISDLPFIVLQADNANQIRSLRRQLLEANVHCVDFTSTMTIGTYKEQQAATAQTPENELEYFGICMFGHQDVLNGFTKKFSLWRG